MQKAIILILALVLTGSIAQNATTGDKAQASNKAKYHRWKFQGKDINWWVNRAVQNRRQINRLKHTLSHNTTIEETIKIATKVYPAFTEHRAWCIIDHESNGYIFARNKQPWGKFGEHATGLYQFLPSTFHSTPFGGFDIYSPLAQSLAAGWMHQNGRSREWAIAC